MTIDDATNSPDTAHNPSGKPDSADGRGRHGRHRPKFSKHLGRKAVLGLGGAVLLGLGLIVGGLGTAVISGRSDASLLLQPTTIAKLVGGSSTVAVRAQVAEVFGNKLIVADESGRALVETGPRGSNSYSAIARPGETITVQGRFDDGFLHAAMLVNADGRVVDLKPAKPPFGPLKDQLARIAGR